MSWLRCSLARYGKRGYQLQSTNLSIYQPSNFLTFQP